MKSRILLLAAVVISVSSCSTMYKSGQTPDDLCYSPAPQQRIANNDNNDDGYYSDNQSNQEYVNVQTDQDRAAYNSDDNYLRMKVRNRAMWSAFDDYAMYSPYYGSSFGLGFGYNPYSSDQPALVVNNTSLCYVGKLFVGRFINIKIRRAGGAGLPLYYILK